MTQDEIIEMAREAGLHLYVNDIIEKPYAEIVVAFANLVAAKEREACAKVCEKLNLYGGSESRQLQRATLKDCAYAIRARGEQALAQPKQDGECKYCTHGCAACDARRQSNVLP